jgi:hypothetical protein
VNKPYSFQKPVRHGRYLIFRTSLWVALVAITAVIATCVYVYRGLNKPSTSSPISSAENTEISDAHSTFISPYFQFQDTGKWVLDKNGTTSNKFVYHKFRQNVLEHTLVVYVDLTPPPLDLEVSRALPIRIVNDNSFDVTNVSDPCIKQYSPTELHKVKAVTISGAAMLCDPDTPQYTVILSEITGDYNLRLKRGDGTYKKFIITFRDLNVYPKSASILNIASSFKAL